MNNIGVIYCLTDPRNRKPIVQYDKSGKLVKEWNCCETATRELKIPDGNIHHALNGKYKTATGFIWKYKNIQL